MEEQVTSGVEAAPAAGEQETVSQETATDEFDLNALLFGEDSESGEETGDAAGPVDDAEQGEETKLPTEDATKAFATKWAAESEKLEEKIRAKVMSELESKMRTTPQEQAQGALQYRDLSVDELSKLADDLGVSTEAARTFYTQQQHINKLNEELRRNAQRDRDRGEYSSAKQYVSQLKTENPSVPDWDDEKVHQYRMKHYKDYGATLPWKEAYRMLLADAVVNGELTRQAQQSVIQQIQKRDTASVGIQSPNPQKKSIDDLPKEQFEKMLEDARAGKFKRS